MWGGVLCLPALSVSTPGLVLAWRVFLKVQGDPAYPHGVKSHQVLRWAVDIPEAQPRSKSSDVWGHFGLEVVATWVTAWGHPRPRSLVSACPGLGGPAPRAALAFIPLSPASFFSAESISQSLNATFLVLIIQWDH